MKTKLIIEKSFIFLALLAFSAWLGSYIVRQLVVFELLLPVTFEIDRLFVEQNITAFPKIFLPIIVVNIITYLLFLSSTLIYMFVSDKKFKKNGWLFMILCILIITAPFELFLLFKDYQLANILVSGSLRVEEFVSLISPRATDFGVFSFIQFFVSISIILLVLLKPLRRNED